jgi:hypothetical protein
LRDFLTEIVEAARQAWVAGVDFVGFASLCFFAGGFLIAART